MKGPYARLWALLAAAFAVMVLLSTFDDLTIFGHPIAKIGIGHKETPQAVASSDAPQQKRQTVEPDTMPKVVLFVGDSMVEGLSPRMAAYADAAGHKLFTVIWYGSTTEKWGATHRLRQYVDRFRPDYVMICLGGNELFLRDVERQRSAAVDSIIADTRGLPFVWIGPPNWRPDTGINKLIASHVGDGRFFLSANLKLDRASDGAHPTRDASVEWMDSVARWMASKADCRLRLDKPRRRTAKATRTIVLTPDD